MPPLDPLGLVLALLVRTAEPALAVRPVTFDPVTRSVSGWRTEAALNLEASPGTRVALMLGRDPPAVTRCVKLANYWCIKTAGWMGEVAADREGHVAFASAAQGAAVAALLLRRYYVDYGRHSALAIVSHWAPASCGPAAVARSIGRRARPDGLAVRGIGSTLRARWLARHGGHGGRMRRSVVPDRLIGTASAPPPIALGLGAAPVVVSAALPDRLLGSLPMTEGGWGSACTRDDARVRAYAAKAASGIAPSITADLALFDPSGRPSANLAHLMLNMSRVEIGPLGASAALAEAAAARLDGSAAPRAGGSGAAGTRRLDEARRPEP